MGAIDTVNALSRYSIHWLHGHWVLVRMKHDPIGHETAVDGEAAGRAEYRVFFRHPASTASA